jgi:hypothetical protein
MKKALLIFLLLSTCNLLAQTPFKCAIQGTPNAIWQCVGPYHIADEPNDQNLGAVTAISAHPINDSLDIYAGTMSGGLWHTNNGGQSWQCLTDNYKDAVCGITGIDVDYSQSKRKIVISTGKVLGWTDIPMAGILYSNDGGASFNAATWDDEYFNKGFCHIVYALTTDSKHQKYFCATAGCIYYSNNGAKSFKKIFPLETNRGTYNMDKPKLIKSMYYNETTDELIFTVLPEVIYPTDGRAPYRSTAQCVQLNRVSNNPAEIEVLNLKEQLLSHATPSGFKEPESMEVIPIKAVKNVVKITMFNRESSNNYYCYYYDLITGKVLEHFNQNTTKAEYNLEHFHGQIINEVNPNIQYIGSYTLEKSENFGAEYFACYFYNTGGGNAPHADVRSVVLSHSSTDGKSDHILLGCDGGISFSSNGGKSFRNLNSRAWSITEAYGLAISPFDGDMMIGTQDNSIIKYNNAKAKWEWNVTGDGYDVVESITNSKLWHGAYNGGELKRCINDEVPLSLSTKVGIPDGTTHVRFLRSLPSGNTYMAGKRIYKLNQYNQLKVIELPNIEHKIAAFDVCKSNEDVMYAVNFYPIASSGFFKTIDGGKSWMDFSTKVKIDSVHPLNIFQTRLNDICINPYDENELWLALGYYSNYENICDGFNRIWHSTDGGNTWRDYSEGLSAIGVNDILFVPGTNQALFAATNVGIYYRKNINDMWRYYGVQFPQCITTELGIDYTNNTLVATTMSRGVWRAPLLNMAYNNPLVLKQDSLLKPVDSLSSLFIDRDIVLKKNAKLTIDGNVVLASNVKIYAATNNQVLINKNATLNYNNAKPFTQVSLLNKKGKSFLGLF